jgi:heterotetrameric sarcosine oxidase gamma subunit
MADISLAARSPLEGHAAHAADGISISEDAGFTLTQVAGFGKAFEKDLAGVVGKLPSKIGTVGGDEAYTVFRIAPQQFWIAGPSALQGLPETALVTPLSSSSCRILLEGEKARAVLARCAPVDFDARHFKPGHFLKTGIHHTPVLIHCRAAQGFHLYAMRSFALSTWEWLVDAAEGLSLSP